MKNILLITAVSLTFASYTFGQNEVDVRRKGRAVAKSKNKSKYKPPVYQPPSVPPAPRPKHGAAFELRGKVVDDETDEAIPGATVRLEGTTHGTTTDDEGAFRLTIPPATRATGVTISSMGYAPKTINYSAGVDAGEIKLSSAAPFVVNTVDIVVVSAASKVEQRLADVPSNVNYIPRRQIQSFGWVTLNDVLTRQPGFSPSQDYDRRTVSARGVFEGWNNNHYLMLVDGVPFNDALYGTAFTWEVNPLVYKNSVEVVRGPGSALYGSNAMFGVISVNTVAPPAERGLAAEGQARVGNLGVQIFDALLKGRGKKLSFAAAANFYNTSGNNYAIYDGSFRTDSSGALARFNTRDARRSIYAFGKLQGEGKFSGFSAQYHYQNFKFETGAGWLWQIPDRPENMQENRHIVVLKYATPNDKRFKQEYVLRYQRHALDWDMRYYPNGSYDGYYPNGVSEYLQTAANDVFLRLQWSYRLPKEGNLLFGTEHTVFLYDGDARHTSNANLDTDYSPIENNGVKNLGPWLAWISGNPLFTHAAYGQFLSPKILNERLQFTAGLRYDVQRFQFNALDRPGAPKENKFFDKFSPRVGINFYAAKRFILKFMAGRAFRYPSPTELFGANTFSLASNLRSLKPELLTTVEFATDWQINDYIKWRNNIFYGDFQNLIGYSVANANLSTNMYSLTTAGIETELNFQYKDFGGFFNYSVAKRINETILDSTISIEKSRTTWAPAHTANLGLNYTHERFNLSLIGRVQGTVFRRGSDVSPAVVAYRPAQTNAWTNLDFRFAYVVHTKTIKTLEFSLLINNLFNTTQFLNKNFAYPFDYQIEGRRFLAGLRFNI